MSRRSETETPSHVLRSRAFPLSRFHFSTLCFPHLTGFFNLNDTGPPQNRHVSSWTHFLLPALPIPQLRLMSFPRLKTWVLLVCFHSLPLPPLNEWLSPAVPTPKITFLTYFLLSVSIATNPVQDLPCSQIDYPNSITTALPRFFATHSLHWCTVIFLTNSTDLISAVFKMFQ